MPSPLDQVTYDAGPAYEKIKLFSADDLPILVTIPWNFANYEFFGEVVTDLNILVCSFATVKIVTGVSPNFVYTVEYHLTSAQTSLIPPNARYRFSWIEGGINPRTFLVGPMEVQFI